MTDELKNKDIAQALRDFGIKPSVLKEDGSLDYTESVYDIIKSIAKTIPGVSAGDVLRAMTERMVNSYYERYVLVQDPQAPEQHARLQLCCYEHDPVFVKIPASDEDWKKINTELEKLVFGIHAVFINNAVEVPVPPPKYISAYTQSKDFGKDYALRLYLHNANVPEEHRSRFDDRGIRVGH